MNSCELTPDNIYERLGKKLRWLQQFMAEDRRREYPRLIYGVHYHRVGVSLRWTEVEYQNFRNVVAAVSQEKHEPRVSGLRSVMGTSTSPGLSALQDNLAAFELLQSYQRTTPPTGSTQKPSASKRKTKSKMRLSSASRRNSPGHGPRFLAEGREHIYLGRTKNGQPKIVWLNDAAAKAVRFCLVGRDDEHDALFLTNRGTPYSRGKNVAGNAIKTAFNNAKERAAKIIEASVNEGGWGDKERARVLRTVTPHWARHNLTSHLLAAKQSKDSIKDDLGWSSIDMVERYGHDMPGLGKSRANLVQFEISVDSDTLLTRANKMKAEK
jgi:hypothetical protein